MDDHFLTISSVSEGEYKDKGSKFLAFAYPVSSEEEIKEILQSKKKEYYDARHVCYAYRLGFPDEHYRVNDDGEPSGTAGKPIYGQILSAGITDVLILVVRYFGGTKLGVSGLINAYREAARSAIEENRIKQQIITKTLKINFSYERLNDVMRVLKDEQLSDYTQDFQLDCKMDISIRLSEYDKITNRLLGIYGINLRKDQN